MTDGQAMRDRVAKLHQALEQAIQSAQVGPVDAFDPHPGDVRLPLQHWSRLVTACRELMWESE